MKVKIIYTGAMVPASVNTGKGRVYRAKGYREYVDALRWLIKASWKEPPNKARWCISIDVWVKGRADVDNLIIKPVMDSGQGILYVNDNQVDNVAVRRRRKVPASLVAEFYQLGGSNG